MEETKKPSYFKKMASGSRALTRAKLLIESLL
jgi:hypothetical protein